MLRRMIAILTDHNPEKPEMHFWPYDTMQLTQGEVQQLAISVDFTLIDVVSPDMAPEGSH